MKKSAYLELPLLIDLDKFLLHSIPFDNSVKVETIDEDELEEPLLEQEDLKYLVVKRASEVLTDVQFVVFLMRYAFGLQQRDIAESLRSKRLKRLNLMSKKTKCKSLLKQENLILRKYKEKFRKEFKRQLSKTKDNRKKQNRKAIRLLEIPEIKLYKISDRDLSRRLALRKLKKGYNSKVSQLLLKFKTRESLDKMLYK